MYNSDYVKVGDVTIGEGSIGVLENLKFDDYYIKEVKAGIGYYIDETLRHNFTVNSDDFDVEMTLENKVLTSKVKIIKHYGTVEDYLDNIMKRESGICFEFYNELGSLVYEGFTDEFGVIELVLPYGKYIIKQINTTDGYSISNDININVNEDTNISITINVYDYKIDVPNASISFFDYVFNLFRNIKELMLI